MKSIGKGYSTTSAFCYISKVSNEKKIQLREILKNIKDLNKKSYLDVGSGVGDVFLDLSNHFEKSVGVEPGDKMFPILKERAKNKKTIKLYKNTWQEFYKKNKNKYDLITSIHSIYFFKDPKKEIKKMLSLLKNSGKLIIVCGDGSKLTKKEEKERFTTYFRHKFLGFDLSKRPYADIDKWFCNIKKYNLKCKLVLANLKFLETNHLSKESEATNHFFKFIFKKWWDEFTEKEKKELKDYLDVYLSKNKKQYILVNNDQLIYIISK
jgi:ubiquinone/menaquinone biosynthesis C-methylase UbiE